MTGRNTAHGSAGTLPLPPRSERPCRRCDSRGFIAKPCANCGRLRGGYVADNLWTEAERRFAHGDR